MLVCMCTNSTVAVLVHGVGNEHTDYAEHTDTDYAEHTERVQSTGRLQQLLGAAWGLAGAA
jgi:hypothetical protein